MGTHGSFVQDAGSVTSMGFVTVGRRGAIGTYSIASGSLTANVSGPTAPGSGVNVSLGLIVGDGENSTAVNLAQANGIVPTGTFTQTGGTVSVLAGATIGRRGVLGSYSISAGSFTQSGATGLLVGNGETAGLAGTVGTFTQTGERGLDRDE